MLRRGKGLTFGRRRPITVARPCRTCTGFHPRRASSQYDPWRRCQLSGPLDREKAADPCFEDARAHCDTFPPLPKTADLCTSQLCNRDLHQENLGRSWGFGQPWRRRSGRKQNGQSQCGAACVGETTAPARFPASCIALGVSSIVVSAQAADVANVDDARIIENAKTGKEWLSNGLGYGVNRFSPLDQFGALGRPTPIMLSRVTSLASSSSLNPSVPAGRSGRTR